MVRRFFEPEEGSRSVLLTVTETDGEETGPFVGQHCLLAEDGRIETSIPLAEEEKNRIRQLTGRGRIGLRPGLTAYYEQRSSAKTAVVCGAGFVASALIRILRMTGYRIVVLEDRPSFGEEARKAGADRVLIGPFAESLRSLPDDPDVSYIVMTRGHRFDMDCLDVILRRPFRYAGMMSSHMRAAHAREEMIARGVSPEAYDRLHSPIGLPIGAATPAEIAVSVAAELIAQPKRPGDGDEPAVLDALRADGERTLAMIVRRRGPSPRSTGTKMIVFRDGTASGTIGGGCFEAEVKRRALQRMQLGLTEPEVMTVDLRPDAEENAGMACGGVIDVLLERL